MPSDVEDIYPLSPMQQGMLFHALEDESGDGPYFEQVVVDLEGPLSPAALQHAWQAAIRRHTALRTVFEWEEVDEPLQIVLAEVEPEWQSFDLRALDAGAQGARFSAFLADDRRRGFVLNEPPLMRFALFRLGDARWRLVWSHHHLLLDGWSIPILFGDVWQALSAGGSMPPLAPARPYRDYIAWLAQQDPEAAREFWQSLLAGIQSPTPLPPGYPDGSGTGGYGRRERPIPPALQDSLLALARQCRVTPGAIHQAAWGLLLARSAGVEAALFGATTSGRGADIPGIERMVGLLINTLPVRVDVDDSTPVAAWLQDLQRQLSEARAYEHCALSQLREWSEMPAGVPLFDSILVIENYPTPSRDAAGGSGVAITDFYGVERTNYPLTVAVVPNETPSVRIEFDAARYHPGVVEGMLDRYLTLLAEMVARPDASPAELAILGEEERRQVTQTWNDTAVPLPGGRLAHECFAEYARKTPDALAIVTEEGQFSFREADEAANRLAWWLRSAGVRRGDVVGVLMSRSTASALAMLAIFKSGGVYLPLDLRLPRQRLAAMIEDAGARIVLSDEAEPSGLATHSLASLAGPLSACSPEDPPAVATADDLAYIIYTSGSTGAPKGTMVPHTGILNLATAQARFFGLDAGSRMLHFASLAFDAAVAEVVVTWVCGASLCIIPDEVAHSGDSLLDALERLRVSVAKMPPSLWAVLSQRRLPSLHTILMVGEAVDRTVMARWAEHARVINAYGPTEATVCATMALCDPHSAAPPPIGPPMANTRAYVLDGRMQPVPSGVAGELYLGGIGISWGYLHRPDLTAGRFVPDPFSPTPGARLYRTGDLARWRPDGQLEFLGRCDSQVKIRGYRIELGEVESALRACPGVSDAVAHAWSPEGGGPRRLVAYVVGTPPGADEMRRFLSERLPAYMVPAHFVPLDALPRTTSGKVDRRALPSPPQDDASLDGAKTPPGTAAEKALAGIWEEVLGLSGVALEDRFFALGGDSISAIRVASRARQAGLGLTVRMIFEHPTLGDLAAAAGGAADAASQTAPVTGDVPLTPIQRFFFDRFRTDPHHFNHAVWVELDPRVTPSIATEALRALAARHEALRTTFAPDAPGSYRAHVADEVAPPFEVVAGRDEALLAARVDAAQAGLSLAGPLWRALYVEGKAGERPRLLLIVHHLVVDVVSWGILLDDLGRAVDALTRGQAPVLPPVPVGYGRWAQRLREAADAPEVSSSLPYWDEALRAASPWPGDPSDDAGTRGTARECRLALDEAATRALEQRAVSLPGRRMESLLVGAWAAVMARRTGRPRVALMLEGHGREGLEDADDLSRTVGWLTARYPVVLDTGGEGIHAVLQRTDDALAGLPHPRLTYGIARYLSTHPGASALRSLPEPNVLLNYLGRVEEGDGSPAQAMLRPCDGYQGEPASPRQERDVALTLELRIAGGRLELQATGSRSAFSAEALHDLAADYVDQLREIAGAAGEAPRAGVDAADAFSCTQRDLLRQSLRAPASGANIVQVGMTLRGVLDVDALRRAWEWLCARHDIFRTAVRDPQSASPTWETRARAMVPFAVADWRDRSDLERAWQAFLVEERRRPLPLGEAPLMRVALTRTGEDAWRLLWTQHHLIMDGWSGSVVLEELPAVYAALSAGRTPDLPPAPSWAAYRRQEGGGAKAPDAPFWRQALEGCALLPALDPPACYGQVETAFPEGLDGEMKAAARRHGVTLNTLCLAAWSVLLRRIHGRAVVAGFIASGREEGTPEVLRMVAPLFRVLPYRADAAAVPEDPEWLPRLQQEVAGAMARGTDDWLAAVASEGGTDLAGVLAVQNYPDTAEGSGSLAAGLSVEDATSWEAMGHRLSARVIPGRPALLRVSFAQPEYSPDTVSEMMRAYVEILRTVAGR